MSSVSDRTRTVEQRRRAVANLRDFLVGGVADTRATPSEVIDEGPQRTLHRYTAPAGRGQSGLPVLMIPPLGSQAACFDLRRGCSLAAHLVDRGRPAYLLDYGPIGLSEKQLGVEHWVGEVIPAAVGKVSEDAGGRSVQLIGWCMGGIMSLLTVAAFPELPVNAVAMVASPFDLSQVSLLAPLRRLGKLTGGKIVESILRLLGGAPASIVGLVFKLTALPVYLKKPLTLFRHRDDCDYLAQIMAIDTLMNNMAAYPGRATLQLYERLVHNNELATGAIQGPTRLVTLANVRVPVMNVAGTFDVLAPIAAAHHVGSLLPNAKQVRLERAPGGHLGVLTGRAAPATTWALIDDFLITHSDSR